MFYHYQGSLMMPFSASFGHVTRDMMMTRVFIFVVANVRCL